MMITNITSFEFVKVFSTNTVYCLKFLTVRVVLPGKRDGEFCKTYIIRYIYKFKRISKAAYEEYFLIIYYFKGFLPNFFSLN